MLSKEKDAVLLADSSSARVRDDDYFFGCKDSKIVKYGKDLTMELRTHEYVGVCKVKPGFMPEFKSMMNKLIEEEKCNYWWENILYQCIATENVYVRDVYDHFWVEVDFIEDYERIMGYVWKPKQDRYYILKKDC